MALYCTTQLESYLASSDFDAGNGFHSPQENVRCVILKTVTRYILGSCKPQTYMMLNSREKKNCHGIAQAKLCKTKSQPTPFDETL